MGSAKDDYNSTRDDYKDAKDKYDGVDEKVEEKVKKKTAGYTAAKDGYKAGMDTYKAGKKAVTDTIGQATGYFDKGKGLFDKGKGLLGIEDPSKNKALDAIENDEIIKQYLFKISVVGADGTQSDDIQFSKVSGYSSELEIDYVQEGGINDFSHPFIKGAKHSQVTLEKGMTKSDLLWNWYNDALNGVVVRKDITIEMKNKNGKGPVLNWTFKRAFPVKWEGTEFDALGNGLVFEKLIIEHEGMVRAVPPPLPKSPFDKALDAVKMVDKKIGEVDDLINQATGLVDDEIAKVENKIKKAEKDAARKEKVKALEKMKKKREEEYKAKEAAKEARNLARKEKVEARKKAAEAAKKTNEE